MIIVNADAFKKKTDSSQDGPDLRVYANFAQMTVIVTGLLLTLTGYIMLSFFINDTLDENYKRHINGAGQTLEQGLAAADLRLQVMPYNLQQIEKHPYYDRVLLATRDGIKVLYESPASPIDADLQTRLVEYAVKNAPQDFSTQLMSDIPSAQYVQKEGPPQIIDRPLAIVKRLPDGSGTVIGLTRFANLVPNDWLSQDPGLSQVIVRNADGKRPLFVLNWTSDQNQAVPDGPFHDEKIITVGRTRLFVEIDAARTNHSLILERSPFVALLFGLGLTFIGLVYVRSNQRQAYKLSFMNRTLAQKNFEMSSEVSERERLNTILRKSENENRAVINAVSDIIFELSAEGEILFLNEAWAKVTGFDISRSLNRNMFDMFYPQDQAEQRIQFQQMVKGQKPAYRSFTRLRSSNGSFRSVELAISMLRHDENHNVRVVGTITDVEERRRAERALSEAEKKFRTIVENNASGIYQVTPDGQYLSANPAMARILGYDSSDDLLREIRNAHQQVYKDYREHMGFLRELDAKGALNNFESCVVCKNGAVIWVSENARAVKDDTGNILYYEGSIEDISQRKEAEIQMREAKVQSDLANRAKSEFLANMSHELRTPLNAIIGFSEIIKDEVFGPMGQKQYSDYAKDIYASGKHLLKIINDVLDVARIDAGERQLNEGVIDIYKTVNACLDLVASKIEAGNFTVINNVDQSIPQLVGEEVAIKQMLTNLLSNAIKFTPAAGRITLSWQVDAEGAMRLSVTDTGVGLDASEIERALSPIGHIEGSLSRSTSGAGLGLTLVKSLMELHGGSLELFSQKGLGTTATLVFPVKRVTQTNGGDKGYANIPPIDYDAISRDRH